jgi:hypothetical protein
MKFEHLPPNDGSTAEEEMHAAMRTLRDLAEDGTIDLYDRGGAFHLSREWGYTDLMHVANDEEKFERAANVLSRNL